MATYTVRFVHKISPSASDIHPTPVQLPDMAFSSRNKLSVCLRNLGILPKGGRITHFRVQGEYVFAFPANPSVWHCITLKSE